MTRTYAEIREQLKSLESLAEQLAALDNNDRVIVRNRCAEIAGEYGTDPNAVPVPDRPIRYPARFVRNGEIHEGA
jgi:hypothetical protein